jgi:hypothetical protein
MLRLLNKLLKSASKKEANRIFHDSSALKYQPIRASSFGKLALDEPIRN